MVSPAAAAYGWAGAPKSLSELLGKTGGSQIFTHPSRGNIENMQAPGAFRLRVPHNAHLGASVLDFGAPLLTHDDPRRWLVRADGSAETWRIR